MKKHVEHEHAWRKLVALRDGFEGLDDIASYIQDLEAEILLLRERFAEAQRELNAARAASGWLAAGEYTGYSVDTPEQMTTVQQGRVQRKLFKSRER
jgi:hypothetical protein